MKKLAIVTTHPIQYNAPFFKLLNERGKVYPKVFYTWPQAIEGFEDPDFGKKVKWDIPLLEGYNWEAAENISKDPSSKSWKGINCPGLINQIKDFAPDAILVYGWNLKSHFKVMRYFKGKIQVWFTGDSTLLDETQGLKTLLRRMWLTLVYKKIDKAFYVGTNNRAYFKSYGVKDSQLVFFPHAIDNERFFDDRDRQYEDKALRWKNKLGYSEGDKVILFAGKLESKKDPFLLLEATQQINSSTNKQIKLLVVGNGPLEPELREKSKGLNFVKFLPFQNQTDIPVIYRMGHIFCLPSQGPNETWGLAVNEAMACSKPVIVSDKVGCYPDLIINNKTGITIKAGDVLELKKAILNLIGSDLKKLGENALNHISEWNVKKKCESIEYAFSK